jgi:hypothetical protein
MHGARGDLDALEEEVGAAGVETRGTECVEDLGDGKLDGGLIFKDRKAKVAHDRDWWLRGEPVRAGVEVAKRFAAQGNGFAFLPVCFDVTTLEQHRVLSHSEIFSDEISWFQQVRRLIGGKYLNRRGLEAKI